MYEATQREVLEAWLRDTLPTVVRPSTVASYANLTRQHIIPGLGHHRLDKVTAVHLRAFLRDRSTPASLKEHLAAMTRADEALVSTTGLSTPLEPRNVLRSFHALCDRAEVRRVRIHDLRHAAASFLLRLITTVGVLVAVRDTTKGPPRSGRPL